MKKILITAGPTYERIDPVRFIGNYSTGKMGFALAEVCAEAGYDVTLVAGPVQIQLAEEWRDKIHRIDVESAGQMYEQVMKYYPEMDGAILCAAVADFTPVVVADQKIKREGDNMIIELKTGNESELLDQIYGIEGVEYASLLDHDGEVTF